MANFGVRIAYPLSSPRPAEAAATRAERRSGDPVAARVRRVLRGVLRGILRAIDDAPFDLAWPPSSQRWAGVEAPGRAVRAAPDGRDVPAAHDEAAARRLRPAA